MTNEEMKLLRVGDVIRHKSAGSKPYVVTVNFGDHVTAVDSVDVTNPIEWDIVAKSTTLWPSLPERDG